MDIPVFRLSNEKLHTFIRFTLPDSGRTVNPMTSLFMHKSIEHLEIGRLSMRNNELVKFIETAEDEDDAKRYEDMLAEVEKKKQHQ